MPIFSGEDLKNLAYRIFLAAKASDPAARVAADHLVEANLTGHDSHGVIRIPRMIDRIMAGKLKPWSEPNIVKEGPSTALVNGNFGIGQYTCIKSVEIAINKAKISGIGCVSTYNCEHVGMLGYYTTRIAYQDMIGLMFLNAGSIVAPIGATKGVLGTNPLSMGIPSSGKYPVVLDMATSSITFGELLVKKNSGEDVKPNMIIDAQGRPTIKVADYFGPPVGAILPFGGYKGYGLSLIVDLLAGGLSGSGCGEEVKKRGGINGILIYAIDISRFQPVSEFKNTVKEFVDKIKNTPKTPGTTEILVCGEPEFRNKEKNMVEGIAVDDKTWTDILGIAAKLSVKVDLQSLRN